MQMQIEVPVVADADEFLRELYGRSKTGNDRPVPVAGAVPSGRQYPVVLPKYWKDKGLVNDYVLIDVLSDELSRPTTC